jgi:hypothetical protein
MDYIAETRGLLKAWVRHEKAKLRQLSLAAAADRLARRVRRLDALFRGFSPDEPRKPAGGPGGGEWTSSGGGHGGGDQGDHGEGRQRQPAGKHARPDKPLKAAARYRDPARRLRVLRAVKAEGELSEAVAGHWMPDSLPFDVLVCRDADGKAITEPAAVRQFLRAREHAARLVSRQGTPPAAKEAARRVLSLVCEAIEVKTLLTSAKSAVHMSGAARARKERWAARFQAAYHVVALDKRRGRKASGHEVYLWRGELSGTHNLSSGQKVPDLAGVLGEICPSCKGGR